MCVCVCIYIVLSFPLNSCSEFLILLYSHLIQVLLQGIIISFLESGTLREKLWIKDIWWDGLFIWHSRTVMEKATKSDGIIRYG